MQNLSKKSFNYSLFFSLVVLNFIPAINEAVKVLFINTSAVSMSVVSQIEWFDLINEVLMAALITPMYSILNKEIKEGESFGEKVFKYGAITVALYGIFLVIVYIYVNSLVGVMFTSSIEEVRMAEQYLELETVAFLVGIIFSYTSAVFIVLGKSKYIYSFVVIKTIALIISNAILIPKYGSAGIAYSNILTNGALGVASMIILIKHKYISFTLKNSKDSRVVREWIRIGCFQGCSVLIANVAYSSIVVKMINDVQGLGDYWVANNFIWGWLLIPAYALAEAIKSECKEGYGELNTKDHYKIIYATVGIWILSIPLWNAVFKYIMGMENPWTVFWIVIKSLPFYVAYLISSYVESIFQGIGKTEYCFIGSLAVNSIYYGALFILTRSGIIAPSLNFAIYMFGFGMVFILCIDLFIKIKVLDKNKKQVSVN